MVIYELLETVQIFVNCTVNQESRFETNGPSSFKDIQNLAIFQTNYALSCNTVCRIRSQIYFPGISFIPFHESRTKAET